MSKDLIVDRKYLSYVKALNFYDGKSYKNLKRGTKIPIGEFSSVRDLNILILLLSRKFLTINKNSFSLNIYSIKGLCIDASFRGWEPENPRHLFILYDTCQDSINFSSYNSEIKFECTGSYFNYLIDSGNMSSVQEIHEAVESIINLIAKNKNL